MYEWGAFGATYGFRHTWIIRLARLICNNIELEEGESPNSSRALLKSGMKSLQALWNVYDYVKAPISNLAETATRRVVGHYVGPLFRRSPAAPPSDSDNEPLVKPRPKKKKPPSDSDNEPLVKPRPMRKKKPPPDSDHDPTAASSHQPQPIPARPRRPIRRGKQNEQGVLYTRGSSDSDNRPLAKAPRGGMQGSGQQAPLVNYAPGVRQMRKGGGKTIRPMAPILEFNEAADDPYVMRQQVR